MAGFLGLAAARNVVFTNGNRIGDSNHARPLHIRCDGEGFCVHATDVFSAICTIDHSGSGAACDHVHGVTFRYRECELFGIPEQFRRNGSVPVGNRLRDAAVGSRAGADRRYFGNAGILRSIFNIRAATRLILSGTRCCP